MNSPAPQSSQRIAMRYFEMWNTGDSSIADQILSPDWTDHAHPEVTGPRGVRQAVERTRAAQPDLRFRIDTVLGDGDMVAVVGSASRGAPDEPAARLVWLLRLREGRLAEMWTYHDTSASAFRR
ncbi:nuclear transport factor 2 family protein [Spirillospora sp. NPDC049652]